MVRVFYNKKWYFWHFFESIKNFNNQKQDNNIKGTSREIVDFEVFKSHCSVIFQDTWVEHVGEHVLEVLFVRKLRPETHPAFCVERDSIGLETELD